MKSWPVARCVVVAGLAAAMLAAAGDHSDFRFWHQRLHWKPCGEEALDQAGVECADVLVPLDYSKPLDRTMTVVISRVQATDPARRRGILMSNPGGPGGEGLNSVDLLGDVITPDVRARYDLIGMDPRGVGRSGRNQRCGWRAPEMIRSAGLDERSFRHDVALAADMASTCLAGDVGRLRQLTTRNTARDMDIIRGSLGVQKINYYGTSYGTYLGAVFTQMFPQQSDRMVFDSAVDPDRYWEGLVQDWGPADESALDDWANWVAARDDQYGLGTTVPEVRSLIEELIRRAGRAPIVVDGFSIDDHLLPFVLHDLLRSFRLNDALANTVRDIVDAADGKSTTPHEPRLQNLLYTLRNGENSALADIACGDVGAPTDPAWYQRNIELTRDTQPVFGALANNIQPCAFWPRPVEPPTTVRNSVPALILQATGDPRTPYAQGVQLHRDLTGSRLVTLQDVRIHLTFRPTLSTCVNSAINDYFSDGALPNTDITCQADPATP